jgi:tetratricopeptide (TPR) repeat protein
MKADPDDFESYFMLSETFVHLKQFPQAIAVLSTAVRQFPENGLAYYLLAVAYEGADQSLPAIVAARRSVEIFNARGDEDGVKRAAVLLAGLIQTAKQKTEDAATANAAKDAQKVLGAIPVIAQPGQPLVPAAK